MAYSRAVGMGMRFSHQRREVGSDLNGFGIDRKIPFLRYPTEHEGEPDTEGDGKATIGRRSVADDDRTVGGAVEAGTHELDHGRVGLPSHRRFDARRGSDGGKDGATAGDGTLWRRVRRIVVGADEPGAVHHCLGGPGETVVVEVPMPADDDRVGLATT